MRGRSVHEVPRRTATVSPTRPVISSTMRLTSEAILQPDDIHTPARQAMRELRDMRQGRRDGIWPMPMQTVLVQEYIMQRRADKALRQMVEIARERLALLTETSGEASVRHHERDGAQRHRGRDDLADQHRGRDVHGGSHRTATVSPTRPATSSTKRLTSEA